ASFAVELYEPELLASADARTTIDYNGRPRSVINLCSYNYLGLANHPEVIAAAQEALKTHGLGACGSPMLSGMTDLHRELERQVAKFLGREDAVLFNSGFGGALGTISGLLRKNDVAILDNRSHLSLRDGAEKFGVESRIPLVYGTFSKAFGALGGFVAGPKETLRYLRFYAHPYVYSCALPAVVVAATLKALEIGIREPELRKKLWENA